MDKSNIRYSKPKLDPAKLKKIFWILDGVVKEEIFKDRPVSLLVANWKKKQLAATSHRTGRLVVVDCDTSPQSFNNEQLNLFNSN